MESGNNLYSGTAAGTVRKYRGTGALWNNLGTPDSGASPIMTMTLNGSDLYAGTYGGGTSG